MTLARSQDELQGVLRELRRLPRETEWAEFKQNLAEPEQIGEYISALANAAALHGKTRGYQVWGIHDETHEVVGTSFDPKAAKVGNEALENWLLKLLAPKINFQFHDVTDPDGKRLILLEITAAAHHPVQFKSVEFIRVASYKKKLKEFPELERELWRVFDRQPFETLYAADGLSASDALGLLDHVAYFDLLGRSLPDGHDAILRALAEDDMVVRGDDGRWCVTNLGAVLFAKRLGDFPTLRRKAVRVIRYRDTGRTRAEGEVESERGYAVDFERLVDAADPATERGDTVRKTEVRPFPKLAVDELLANAMIHQDFSVTGAGPMVEVFPDRMEVTNPGEPLVAVDRFVNTPPKSRNEQLASFMRRIDLCEERGSGVDTVVEEAEKALLPAPLFEVPAGSTRSVLFAFRPLAEMDKSDRVRACYLHACLRYENRNYMTNASLRERFGISASNSAQASRYIKEALDAEVIRLQDPNAATKLRRYLPVWA